MSQDTPHLNQSEHHEAREGPEARGDGLDRVEFLLGGFVQLLHEAGIRLDATYNAWWSVRQLVDASLAAYRCFSIRMDGDVTKECDDSCKCCQPAEHRVVHDLYVALSEAGIFESLVNPKKARDETNSWLSEFRELLEKPKAKATSESPTS